MTVEQGFWLTLHLGNSFGQLAEQHNWYSQLNLLFALIFN